MKTVQSGIGWTLFFVGGVCWLMPIFVFFTHNEMHGFHVTFANTYLERAGTTDAFVWVGAGALTLVVGQGFLNLAK